MALDFVTNQEVILAARKKLEQGSWDYLVGGSESETTMRRNRLGFDRLALRPRVLEDVSRLDPSTFLLGHKLRIPVILAPIGSLQTFDPGGAAAVTRAAGAFGTVHVVSSVTEPSLEETAAATTFPKFYQLYVHGDWPWVEEMVSRVKAAGYAALCYTADTAVYSRRERPLIDRWTTPSRRSRNDPLYSARMTWESLDRLRDMGAPLPFVLKGVATAEDAALAVEHGVRVVWVSNHGGRQLDHGRGSIETLPEIVDAVAGRAEIVLDGGVQRGTDVLKALALGANAVAIGKLQGWGLAAGGTEGVLHVLELLEAEILTAMGLLGITHLKQLTRSHVCADDAVAFAHEMSSFINMPGSQVK